MLNDMIDGPAVIDPSAGFAYFGFFYGVVKIRLSDFSLVGSLTLNASQVVFSAAIDPAGGFAYFGTTTLSSNNPGTIVRVRLSDFTRAGNLTLSAGEGYPASAVI